MPLYGEGEWGFCRYGLSGGCLPPDWFQISYDSDESNVLAFTEDASANVFAGTDANGKIFKYNGTSWTLAYDSPESAIYAMIRFDSYLYAGTGSNGLIYRSSDGSTWTLAYDSPVSTIRTFEIFNNDLYAGGSDGIIYKTSDGTTWTLAYDSPSTTIYDLKGFAGHLYAAAGGSDGLIYRSDDGATWTLAYDPPGTTVASLGALGGDRPDGVPMILAGDGSSFKVYKSINGTTWEISYEGPVGYGGVNVLYGTDAMVYAGSSSGGILLRSDNSVDWSISYDSNQTDINALHGVGFVESGYGSQTYGECGWGGTIDCRDEMFVGTGNNGITYTMDNMVSADIIPDIVQPDGGETITTDTYTIQWSIERSTYTDLVWDIEYTRNWSTNRDWETAVDDTGGDPGHTGAPLTGISVGQKVTQNGNYLEATWNVLPIIDSSDMKIRIRTRDTSSSCGCAISSWNESTDLFVLSNGPC